MMDIYQIMGSSQRNIELAKKFLLEQQIVKNRLDIVKSNILEVHSTCQAMSNQVNSGNNDKQIIIAIFSKLIFNILLQRIKT